MVAVAGKTTRKRKIVLGPKDQGRKMSLDDFDRAITPAPGLYELNKGVIEVGELPSIKHGQIVDRLKSVLYIYRDKRPTVIHYIGGGGEAKVLSENDQSERHPDVSVYLSPPPLNQNQPWSEWTPEIAVEVVSESSVNRDYEEKPPEYLTIGIREYWIVDPLRQVIVINTRWRATWKPQTLKPGQIYQTKLLPGFKLEVRKILAAGK